ncbi:MAG: HAMP domain-containing histidine kinase, partial [Hyphomonas sp.]|nr:HAMP domain-containing histidine kinase [Hyphomonas sp.]
PMGGLLILFKDITSELNLRTKYNAMIKTQSKTLDSLHEAVVVFGSDGRLKLSNNAFAELWGVEAELLKDEPDYDDIADFCVPLFHDRNTWSAIKAHITDPGARQETTGEMRRSDGSILTYVTKPLPDGNTLIGFADVSAQRSVETALRDRAEAFETADRLKTEFVKNVSYQLRSPLQTILGYGEFLQMERIGDLNEAQRDKVDAICEASNHLNDLIGNILDLAMIEAGRMDLDISEVDLKALIDEAVSIGVTNAADTEVEVIADIAADLGRIEADEKRVRQILFNLMSNALRFTDPGGTVTISAERMGDTAKLTVKDNGRGIPAEDQATRFDSFTSSDRRGAGLGLSLVKHFVQLHGGNVGIKSRPGGGTEVVCWIPVEATPQNGTNRPEKLAA